MYDAGGQNVPEEPWRLLTNSRRTLSSVPRNSTISSSGPRSRSVVLWQRPRPFGACCARRRHRGTAKKGTLLVGVSRAITDFHFCTYLSDLAVDEKLQRRGIGRELIRRTHEAAGIDTTLILLAAPGRGITLHTWDWSPMTRAGSSLASQDRHRDGAGGVAPIGSALVISTATWHTKLDCIKRLRVQNRIARRSSLIPIKRRPMMKMMKRVTLYAVGLFAVVGCLETRVKAQIAYVPNIGFVPTGATMTVTPAVSADQAMCG